MVLFAYVPMYGVLIAFKRYNLFQGILGSPWAANFGFEHFIDFFKTPESYPVMRNTIVIALLKLVLTSIPPVILAIILNEVRNMAFKKVTQTISYLPHFVSWAVVGGLVFNFLDPTSGPLNNVLLHMGLIHESIDFISSTHYVWTILVLSDMWKTMGWSSIIYLAVIVSIDPTLYEAIDMDGGGRWAKIRYVTWPFLKGTFMILLIMTCGKIMSGAVDTFDQCYIFGNASNRATSDILGTYILRVGLGNARYSFATAVNLFQSIINLALLLSANKLSKWLTDKSLF